MNSRIWTGFWRWSIYVHCLSTTNIYINLCPLRMTKKAGSGAVLVKYSTLLIVLALHWYQLVCLTKLYNGMIKFPCDITKWYLKTSLSFRPESQSCPKIQDALFQAAGNLLSNCGSSTNLRNLPNPRGWDAKGTLDPSDDLHIGF